MTETSANQNSEGRVHHRHLEQSREQIIELLSRQALERELVSRTDIQNQDVASQLLDRQHHAQLAQRLASFHPADIAFVLESLAPEAREMAWHLVSAEQRGAVLLEISDAVLPTLVGDMRPDEIVAAIRDLGPDEIADLVAELPDDVAPTVLAGLDRAEQFEVRSALSFPEGSVGAMMDLHYVSVREDATLEAVQRLLRRLKHDLPEENTDIFVVDRSNELRGKLSLEQLVLNEPEQSVNEVMTRAPTFFFTDDPIKDAVAAFEKYDLLSAPVVNLHQQVVGRITVDAVLDEINERAQSESLRQAGLSKEEDLYGPVLQSSRNRWPWLGLNLLTSFGASRVIGVFDNVIVQFTVLATLIPIIASLGGNTGTQTMSLVTRAMALDQLRSSQLRQTFIKEFLVALLNGSLWGAALALMTYAMYGKWEIALVIYGAMILQLLLAAMVGVAIPVVLRRIGRDPVMGSSVLLTATTDAMGFFIFLGLAAIFLL
ncbi:magnesium transporter [Stenotrophobium rhamnosiphilum]|uniref:Magnesium transporter MgtE n=1 Tax=Stenotrophobium rhamnosiphilum TaxID=2029166 RepID=A0A2T5MGH2_9GAMM|nr:magnesium transporter [Stenotrophobium rhamnosiphilum]PTU31685.1 magnesium transporter [Stenotrophobium rhamnosiphilum]